MSKDRGALLFSAHIGMELCWLYACAAFLMISIVQRPFPLLGAIGTFLLAAALGRVVRGRGLRVISILGLHIIGFLLAASWIVYTFNYSSYPYFGTGWLLEFSSKARDPLEWLILVIILTLALVFWLSGVALSRRSTAYLSICTRFDYGVTAFFCLFILKSLLLVKGGIEVRDPAPALLLFPFFVFSLLAVGLARNRGSTRRHFLTGYRGVGILLSFAAVVLAFAAGLILFFMTYLSAAAEAGYGVLKSAAGPLIPILERVLLFLFGNLPQEELFFPATGQGEAEYIPLAESSWFSEPVQKILGGGVLGLVLLTGLFLCALGAWYLLRWLFSRTSKADLGMGFKWTVRRWKGYRDEVRLYRALLMWGRRSGLPHLLSETPAEYGSRLKKQFPLLTGEIGGIVEAFNLVVYGEVALDEDRMVLARLSWKRLRSPRYWPARLKSWFFQERG